MTYGQGQAEEREGEMNGKSSIKAYTIPYIKQIANGNLLMTQGTPIEAL